MLNQLAHALRRCILLMLATVVVSILATACAAIPLDQLLGTTTAGTQATRPAATATRKLPPTKTAVQATVTATRTERPIATVTPKVRATRRPAAAVTSRSQSTSRVTSTPDDGLPTINQANLPREARETTRLIQAGGPFPYDKDGAIFQNREGLLPKRPSGYYREYTVITPGSSDRGARRIIAGKGGELYYTDDHYDSFKRVIP